MKLLICVCAALLAVQSACLAEDASAFYTTDIRARNCPANTNSQPHSSTAPDFARVGAEWTWCTTIHSNSPLIGLCSIQVALGTTWQNIDVNTVWGDSTNTITRTKDVYVFMMYRPEAEDDGSFVAYEMFDETSFTGGGQASATATNLVQINLPGGNIGLQSYGNWFHRAAAGTSGSPGARENTWTSTMLVGIPRPPLNLRVPQVRPSNPDWLDPLKRPYGITWTNEPFNTAMIYTNNGGPLEYLSNWVFATAVATDSNGLASVVVTNWALPADKGFFLFQTTNSP